MRFTAADLIAYQSRRAAKIAPVPSPSEPTDNETGRGGLHEQIIAWCNSQWPRVKFIHSRTDQRSTVAVGTPDFILFLPQGRTVAIEAKAKGKKATPEQQAWLLELHRLGHQAELCWSYAEFLQIVETESPTGRLATTAAPAKAPAAAPPADCPAQPPPPSMPSQPDPGA